MKHKLNNSDQGAIKYLLFSIKRVSGNKNKDDIDDVASD